MSFTSGIKLKKRWDWIKSDNKGNLRGKLKLILMPIPTLMLITVSRLQKAENRIELCLSKDSFTLHEPGLTQ